MSNQSLGARLLRALIFISACAVLACSPAAPADPKVPDGDGPSENGGTTSDASGNGSSKVELTGPKAPDFTLPTLDGDSISLSDYEGKNVVLLDFWATHCDPCLAEMPELVDLYNKHKADGLIVLAVTIDDQDSMSKVASTVKKYKMTFPILLDEDTEVVTRYNPDIQLPFTMVIARNGVIVLKRSGYQPGDEASMTKLVEAIDKALAAK